MTTKQYLGQINKLDKMIDDRIDDLEELRVLAMNVSGKLPVADLVQTSGAKDRLERLIVRILDAEKELSIVVDNYIERKKTITKQIEDDCMTAEEYQILHMRYINGYRFPQILVELKKDNVYVSERSMYRIYGQAMKKFEKSFGKSYLSA